MNGLRKISGIMMALILLVSCKPSDHSKKESAMNGLVPKPVFMEKKEGNFTLSSSTRIIAVGDSMTEQTAFYLSSEIKRYTGWDIEVTSKNKPVSMKNAIVLLTVDTSQNKEGYEMMINNRQVNITGNGSAGLFYGAQTLLQLVFPKGEASEIRIPALIIRDEPRFVWRGMHLDVCRHFFPVEFIKKMLDQMAALKMNIFHWHLTDDQGWRIDIEKYPKLKEISAWRDKTLIGHASDRPVKFDTIRYGGYYTKEQISEVVEYAKSRHITVVPEIEMPGHAVAALAAYPEISCTGGPFEVWPMWGINEDVFCAGKEETFEFIENVLTEVTGLFPGEYIHVGGDECPKTRWKACPDCQKRIKEEGLKDELELQSYFIKRVEKFLASKGKKLIGWDEILEGGLPERASVMSWRGEEGGIEAASSGHDVVMTPGEYCYFDKYQSEKNEPLTIGGLLTLEKVYSYEPVPEELDQERRKHVLGPQANVWTEYILSEDHAEYMIFPRLCAMAEIQWMPAGKRDFKDFSKRLEDHKKRLEFHKVNFRK